MEITVEEFDKVDVRVVGVVLLQPTMQVKNGDKIF